MAYIDPNILETYAEAPEGTDADIWQQLVDAASLQFDRAANVAPNFFAPASDTASVKYFRASGTEYVRLLPYLENSITAVTVDSTALDLEADPLGFFESDNFLVFNYEITKNKIVAVTAKWGFAEVPADIKQAVIEQALFLWRKKDMSFADLSGVASSVAAAEASQMFLAVARKYADIYSGVVIA